MIRGIKPGSQGYTCNGMIVTAVAPEFIPVVNKAAWYVTPAIQIAERLYRGVLEENLFPLDNPTDDEVDTISTLKETHD